MARFKPTLKLQFRPREFQEFQHDTLIGKKFDGNELFFLGLGLALIALSTLFMNGINPLQISGNGWAGIGFGGFLVAVSAGKIALRSWTRRLIPEENLNDRLNIDYRTLHTVMQEREVQPRLIINGKRYYAPTDFGDVSTLLRASSAPQPQAETLLRAASAQAQPSPQHLLRPVIASPASPTPATHATPAIPEQPQSLQHKP